MRPATTGAASWMLPLTLDQQHRRDRADLLGADHGSDIRQLGKAAESHDAHD
jgi:hypothetical protein